MHPTQSLDYRLGPIEIFLLALDGPTSRRTGENIPEVANHVGKLHQFGAAADCRCMLHLKPLALSLGREGESNIRRYP